MDKFNTLHSGNISKYGYNNQSVSVDTIVDLKEFVVSVAGTNTAGDVLYSAVSAIFMLVILDKSPASETRIWLD